jgi:beta-lactamase regulating signal transducer with metallopeptidase domain
VDVLINWLGQASVLVLIVSLLLAPWRGLSAAMRYGVWWIALWLLLLMPLRSRVKPDAGEMLLSAAGREVAAVTTTITLPDLPNWIVALAICLWLEWMAFCAVRLARALTALAEARAACTPFPAERERQLPLWLLHRDQGRKATLALSTRVSGAAVLGLRAPIIAISPSLTERLTDAELDQVIGHELAHVRRRDDFAALVQATIDAIAGFHPALRAVQRRLHLEREMACDDWVVRVSGSAKRYAACLTRVASIQGEGMELLAPAALAPPQLTARITRLLDERRSRSRASHIGLLAATPLLVGLAFVAGELDLVAPRPSVPLEARPDDRRAEQPTTPAVRDAAGEELGRDDARVSRQASEPDSTGRRLARAVSVKGDLDAAAAARFSLEPLPTGGAPATKPNPSDFIPSHAIASIGSYPPAVFPSPSSAAVADTLLGVTTTPWSATANAGVAIGQGSQKAAVATARLFSRMGKSIARTF